MHRAVLCVCSIVIGCAGDDAPTVASSDKELTSVAFLASENPGLAADVDAVLSGQTATAALPYYAAVDPLVATFTTTGARVEIDGVSQTSGVTENDFSTPRTFTVIAEDGSMADYVVTVTTRPSQQSYLKPYMPTGSEGFGGALDMSSEGSTLAIGGLGDRVHIFVRTGATWTIDEVITGGPRFGTDVELSGDGNTLAVGVDGDSSNATGIDGDETDTSARQSGAVYVYSRQGTAWVKQAYVKASNTDAGDFFGTSLALSDDGNTLAVGANGESSAATTIGGNQADNTAMASGAVYVFTRSGSTWSQHAYVKSETSTTNTLFGEDVALSADGNTLAVGAPGVNRGVFFFERSQGAWSASGSVTGTNIVPGDRFAVAIALSADGTTLAATAPGAGPDPSALLGGTVYVFRKAGTWSQQAALNASTIGPGDKFGSGVDLSSDGNLLVTGAWYEDSAATGIDGDASDNSAMDSGAGYLFSFDGAWTQKAYVKASNTDRGDSLGFNLDSVAISGDGHTFMLGAPNEQSLTGNQDDNDRNGVGAVYVFH